MATQKKRYALVGTGGRAKMYVDALAGEFSESNELVALCDLSQTRMDWYNDVLAEEHGHKPVPTYHADAFAQMVAETKPDTVIVT